MASSTLHPSETFHNLLSDLFQQYEKTKKNPDPVWITPTHENGKLKSIQVAVCIACGAIYHKDPKGDCKNSEPGYHEYSPVRGHTNGHSSETEVSAAEQIVHSQPAGQTTAPVQPKVEINNQPGTLVATVMTEPEPEFLDGRDLLGYLRLLFEPGDWINLQFIHQTEKYPGTSQSKVDNNYSFLDKALSTDTVKKISDMQDAGWNSYVAMNAFTPNVERRRKIDVKTVRSVYVEFDENSQTGLDRIETDVKTETVPLPDFILQSSPGKYYVIWRVKDFSVEQQEGLNSALQQRYGSDPASVDASRVLRLPGTRNLKYDSKPVVEIIDGATGDRCSPTDFKIDYAIKASRVDYSAAPESVRIRVECYEQACETAGVDVGYMKEWEGGYLFEVDCPNYEEHTGMVKAGASVKIHASGRISYGCFHGHCQHLDWKNYYRPWMEMKAKENGFESVLKFGDKEEIPEPEDLGDISPDSTPFEHKLNKEEYEAELDKEYPVIPLAEQAGPWWDDDILYGPAGELVKKASQYNEAHPAGMLVDFLVAFGNMIGRGPYFNINSTRHYTNEFLARVGDSSYSRKGGGRDAIDEPLKIIAKDWYQGRVVSGFGSSEAIVHSIRDTRIQKVFQKKKNRYEDVVSPGVDDKRLCIREPELASIFVLAGKAESRADIVLREGWDSKPLRNIVKGASEGINNSAFCMEPHISVSGDTTRHELVAKLPKGADENGFGNRFLYCYVYRVKLCPNGGPDLDWAQEIPYFYEALQFAQKQKYVPLSAAAKKVWIRMYTEIENNHLPGQAGKMTSRAAAHIRRLALIYAMVDKSGVVESRHLQAARKLWDYCEDSARFIFNKYTREHLRILTFVEKKGETSLTGIREELFHRHKLAGWIRAQVAELAHGGYVTLTGDAVKFVKK
jgi:hypothetical protein